MMDSYITYCCHVAVSGLFLFLIMLCVGLQCVNRAVLGHTLFDFISFMMINGVAKMLKQLCTKEGGYCNKQ